MNQICEIRTVGRFMSASASGRGKRQAGVKDVIDKITKRIRDSDLVQRLTEKVLKFVRTRNPSDDLSQEEVSAIYRQDDYGDDFDMPGGQELDVGWTNHAEYRSDLRGIDPSKVNEAIRNFAETHPGRHQKVNLMNRGIGKAVVDVNTMNDPEQAHVVTVMASDGWQKYLVYTPETGGEYYTLEIPEGVESPKEGDQFNLNGIPVQTVTVSSAEDIAAGRGGSIANSMRERGIVCRVNCLPIGHEWLKASDVVLFPGQGDGNDDGDKTHHFRLGKIVDRVVRNMVAGKIFWHGSDNSNITQFRVDDSRFALLGAGIYLYRKRQSAEQYGKYVYKVAVSGLKIAPMNYKFEDSGRSTLMRLLKIDMGTAEGKNPEYSGEWSPIWWATDGWHMYQKDRKTTAEMISQTMRLEGWDGMLVDYPNGGEVCVIWKGYERLRPQIGDEHNLTGADRIARKLTAEVLPEGYEGWKMENVHISRIRMDDAVFHDGKVYTVGRKDIHEAKDGAPRTLFGDSYDLGYKKVKRLLPPRWSNGKRIARKLTADEWEALYKKVEEADKTLNADSLDVSLPGVISVLKTMKPMLMRMDVRPHIGQLVDDIVKSAGEGVRQLDTEWKKYQDVERFRLRSVTLDLQRLRDVIRRQEEVVKKVM